MTYAAIETSAQDGAPVELYRFTMGAAEWFYTSSEADVEYDGETWLSRPITRNSLAQSPERIRNNLQLQVPRTLEVAEIFRVSPPSDIVAVTLLRYHRGDAESVVLWMGRLLSVAFKQATADLSCEPVSTSARRTGLRRLYQRQCPHVLYSSACGVMKIYHAWSTTVTGINGVNIDVASLEDKPYAGGYIEFDNGEAGIERRFIRSAAVTGTGLVLSHALPTLEVGSSITVFPGCDHTTATCRDVFNNLPNYGGFPYIPQKNPFDGNPVY